MTGPLCAAAHLRAAKIDGNWVLLDIRDESYAVLDDVASAFWDIMTESRATAPRLAGLAHGFGEEPGRVAADYATFVHDCLRQGLVARPGQVARDLAPAPQAARSPWLPPVAAAFGALFSTAHHLKRHGFRATYERYAALPRGRGGADVARCLRPFRRAENLYVPARAPEDCLLRSLALYRYLNAAGVAAEHVIGVQRFPFEAHAWVEVAGRPVLQAGTGSYTGLARM
ncbi:MAG: lasso peptide biosynthesis B2 protein [Pseudomonadota bacterium]